jgi:putative transcriptional regulator
VSQDSLAPALLVAMPQLLDPNFRRAVVLLVHHDAEGTLGVVVNRSTDLTAPELCESIDLQWPGDPEARVDWGGPVQPETGWLLFDGLEADPDDTRDVTPDIHFSGSLDLLRRMLGSPPENLRVMLGYAGWGPGQLEAELAEGAWLVAPVDPQMVFDVDLEAMWTTVVRSLGIEPATLVPSRGVH